MSAAAALGVFVGFTVGAAGFASGTPIVAILGVAVLVVSLLRGFGIECSMRGTWDELERRAQLRAAKHRQEVDR